MISGDFLHQIVKFWQIKFAIVCINDLKGDYEHSGLNSLAIPFLVTTASEKTLSKILSDTSNENTLILCESLSQIDVKDDSVFSENKIWFLSKSNYSAIGTLPINLKSSVFLIDPSFANKTRIFEIFRVKMGKPILQEIGSWTTLRGLEIWKKNKWDRRTDFQGQILINTILHYPPLAVIKENENPVGIFQDIVNVMKQRLNFTILHTSPSDLKWGSKNEDGSWNGMVGMLARKEADISTAGLTITQTRSEAISFAIALHENRNTISVIASGNSIKLVNVGTYLATFKKETWFCTCIILALISSALYLTTREGNESLGNTFKMFIQKDITMSKRNASFRIAASVGFFFSIVFYASYSAVFTSVLTVTPPGQEIKSFSDLLSLGYEVYIWKSGQNVEYLKNSSLGSDKSNIYQNMINGQSSYEISSVEDGLKALKRNVPTVFFGGSTSFFGHPEVVAMPKFLESYRVAESFGLQRNSEFQDVFNHFLLKMDEDGILDKITKKWKESSRDHAENSVSSNEMVIQK